MCAALFAMACGQASNTSTTTANAPAANKPAGNTTATTPSPAATVETAAMGKQLYTQYCSKCHKDDGTGGPTEIEGKKIKPDNLTSDKIKAFSDEKIAGYIKDGVPDEGMPAFKDRLSEEQIAAVIGYIRTELQK